MVRVLKFSEFINEDDNEFDKKFNKYIKNKEELCPRCGETEDLCKCEDDDYWSTNTFHRVPKGKTIKNKPKQQFKK